VWFCWVSWRPDYLVRLMTIVMARSIWLLMFSVLQYFLFYKLCLFGQFEKIKKNNWKVMSSKSFFDRSKFIQKRYNFTLAATGNSPPPREVRLVAESQFFWLPKHVSLLWRKFLLLPPRLARLTTTWVYVIKLFFVGTKRLAEISKSVCSGLVCYLLGMHIKVEHIIKPSG